MNTLKKQIKIMNKLLEAYPHFNLKKFPLKQGE